MPHGIVMFKEESDDLHRGRNHFFKEESTFFKDEPSSFSPCIVSDDYIQEVMDIDEVNCDIDMDRSVYNIVDNIMLFYSTASETEISDSDVRKRRKISVILDLGHPRG